MPSLVRFGPLFGYLKKTYFQNYLFEIMAKFSLKSYLFFPRQAIAKITFILHSSYTGDTQYRVWFYLDNSLTRLKRPFFKIRHYSN